VLPVRVPAAGSARDGSSSEQPAPLSSARVSSLLPAPEPPPEPSSRQSGQDSLWNLAVQVATARDTLVPGVIVTRTETLNDEGGVKDVEEITSKVYRGAGGVETDVLMVLKNGKDITAERKAQWNAEGEEQTRNAGKRGHADKQRISDQKLSFSLEEHPFLACDQERVTEHPTGNSKLIDGRRCSEYSFVQKRSEKTVTGTAWLEEATGVPLEITFAPDPLPRLVKEMSTTLRYVDDPPLGWRVREMVTQGMGKFLFFKKRLRVTGEFTEYWHLHPAGETPGP
jgi:hypothetical protein